MFVARFNPSTPPMAPADWGEIRAGVSAYLNAGAIVFISMEFGDDELDPKGSGGVPIGFRTDGEWVWSMEVPYYVDHHSMPIDPELLARIRALSFSCPQAGPRAVNEAWDELQRLAEEFSSSVERE